MEVSANGLQGTVMPVMHQHQGSPLHNMVVVCQIPAQQQLVACPAELAGMSSAHGQQYQVVACSGAAITSPALVQQQQYLMPATSVAQALQGEQLVAAAPQQQHSGATIFFAGVNPVAAPETLLRAFAQFGRVMDLNLFRPYKGSRTNKGCGLVVFSQFSEAAAALDTLNRRYVWPGARSPMIVEWWDPSKQHMKRRTQPVFADPCGQPMVAYQQQSVSCMQIMAPSMAGFDMSLAHNFNQGCLVMPGYSSQNCNIMWAIAPIATIVLGLFHRPIFAWVSMLRVCLFGVCCFSYRR